MLDLLADSDDAAIVGSTIGLSKQLGLTVVAEGIENRAAADFLVSMGCEEGQGYFFGGRCRPRRSRHNFSRLNSTSSVPPETPRPLAPAGDRHAKQEGDEQAGQRRFAGNRRDGCERSAGLSRLIDCMGETIDGGVQATCDLADGLRDVGCDVDGAFGHAGLRTGLRYFRAQARDLRT
ncbi:hypothetical protein ACVWY3_000442 [Bradyrhizobium sp. USDA 4486]